MNQFVCNNCGSQFTGKYCNNCGEKLRSDKEKSISHFFEEGIHFFTHFEGTFFTSLKAIFTAPGKLSLDYCNGIRKKYFKPLSFFMLLILLYLLFPYLEGLNMKMEYYPKQDFYGDYAANKISQTLSATGFNIGQLSESFHKKAETVSKFLLLVLIPFTAFFFYAFGFKRRKYLFDHMVFSAEINAVFLFFGFLLLPLLLTVVAVMIRSVFHANFSMDDKMLGIIIYAVLLIYLSFAIRRFYKYKVWQIALLLPFFCIVHTFIVFNLYKFLLFVLVINQIH